MFTAERTLRILLMFVPEARSVSQVAIALGEPVAKIFYHVTRFIRQRLIVVEREEKRQGKPVKFYRAVAQSFLLPEALIDRPCTQGLSEELRRALHAAMAEKDIEGVMFSADEDGGINMSLSPASPRQAVPSVEIWYTLRLPDETASALADELSALLARYERLSGRGKEFLVHAALTRRRPH